MKRLIVLMILLGWTKIAEMDGKNWCAMEVPQKKAITELIADKFFEAYPWCSKAEFRILEGINTEYFVRCVERRS